MFKCSKQSRFFSSRGAHPTERTPTARSGPSPPRGALRARAGSGKRKLMMPINTAGEELMEDVKKKKWSRKKVGDKPKLNQPLKMPFENVTKI